MKQKVVLIIISLLIISGLKAQTDLTKHSVFFQKKAGELQTWLDASNLSTILKFDIVDVQKEKVYLVFTAKDKHNWDRLDSMTQVTKNKSLSYLLFKKCTFLMDLEFEQCELEIETMDFFIYVKYKDNTIATSFEQKMGEISDNINIPIEDLGNEIIQSEKQTSTQTIEELKKQIEKKLKKHFKKHKAFFEDYQFISSTNKYTNKLKIEINNVVDVILDKGYFEHIEISFDFEQKNDKVYVEYELRGKYAGGIIWAPHSSRYKDMSPGFSTELIKYKESFSNKIIKILTK